MFDVSLTELMVIGVVALIVIGPERLPKVARTVGHLLGRAQRYVNDVKSDIQREIELDELRKFKSEMETAAQDVHQSLNDTHNALQEPVQQFRAELDEVAREASGKPALTAGAETTAAADPHASPANTAGTGPGCAAGPGWPAGAAAGRPTPRPRTALCRPTAPRAPPHPPTGRPLPTSPPPDRPAPPPAPPATHARRAPARAASPPPVPRLAPPAPVRP
ncbi:Sec-independent protein translocase protein TatB, partial [Achromobacter ruhlandii]|uniref:Sec-independent protein translocase protein TatB n=3 Tax=Achromobacter TaxID=222 RepID=UPI003D21D8C1